VQREREREKAVGWLSMGEGRGELKLETDTEGQSQFRDLLTVSLGAKRGGRGSSSGSTSLRNPPSYLLASGRGELVVALICLENKLSLWG
jgi:hypothetical protein